MNQRKNFYLSTLVLGTLSLTILSGCEAGLPLKLDLERAVSEDTFAKMTPAESALIKDILFSHDPEKRGAIRWAERAFQPDWRANENLKIVSSALLVAFVYPESGAEAGYEYGAIFTNVHKVEDANCSSEYIEWVNVARLPTDESQVPLAVCRLMLWFSPESRRVQEERLLEVVEAFQLVNDRWEVVGVRSNAGE
ncbi:MAG: hypothetical protein ACYTEQ_15115 [Planctomycetota bacterium]